jgi:ribonuclease R
MKEHLGEEYSGVVTAATSFGLFVTLDAMYVEGLVHITELGGEYFRFDEMRQELRGERTGMRYAIGTRVRIQVSRVDLDGRKIDFRLVNEGELLGQRQMGEKSSPRDSADRVNGARLTPAGRSAVSSDFLASGRKKSTSKAPKVGQPKSKSDASQKRAPRKRR